MNGSASVPVGSAFAKLNPPMSAKAGMPATATVYFIPGCGIVSEAEARLKAIQEANRLQRPVEIMSAVVPLECFQACDVIQPDPPIPFDEIIDLIKSIGSENRKPVERNPLTSSISEGVNGVFEDFMYDDDFSFLEIRSSCGVHSSPKGERTATDEEVFTVDVTMVFDGTIDARRDMVKQLRKFLASCSKRVESAKSVAAKLTDYRDRSAINAVSEVA